MERVARGTNDCARWASYGSPFSVVASGGTLAAGLSMVMDVTLERFPFRQLCKGTLINVHMVCTVM